MKIIWVTNILFDHHLDMMNISDTSIKGGTWLYAAYDGIKNRKDIELHIITTANISERKIDKHNNSYFYILPGGGRPDYDILSRKNRYEWERIYNEVLPDVMIVWGTESRHAYLAMQVMRSVPKVIYVQGVINSIVKHYYDGVPFLYRFNSLRDIANFVYKKSQLNVFKFQQRLECEMFNMAKAIIVENDWCECVCKNINPSLLVFKNKLPIHNIFLENTWDFRNIEENSIFTNAGGYPIKGHHILFEALSIVKSTYPKFKCYVPGNPLSENDVFKRRTGYVKYLKKLIKEGQLESNIIFTGPLSSDEMMKHLKKCNLFVMPSVVENHSSSLIEAMVMGVPCVSSLVGGVANLIRHKRNGFIYNCLDSESLAGLIISVFQNKELAQNLGDNAHKIILERKENFGDEMLKIYNSILSH